MTDLEELARLLAEQGDVPLELFPLPQPGEQLLLELEAS
jgi:hypothetical protein